MNGIAPATVDRRLVDVPARPRDRGAEEVQHRVRRRRSRPRTLRDKLAEFYARRTITRRPILPEDNANAICWLAGDAERQDHRPRDPGRRRAAGGVPAMTASTRRLAAAQHRPPCRGQVYADLPLHHLLQRHAVSGDRQGGGRACSSGWGTRSSSARRRPAADRCTTTPATRADALPLMRHFVRVFAGAEVDLRARRPPASR